MRMSGCFIILLSNISNNKYFSDKEEVLSGGICLDSIYIKKKIVK